MIDRLEETLRTAGHAAAVALMRVGNPNAHNNLAPSTYHTVGQRLIRLDWDSGRPPTREQYDGANAIIQSFDFRPLRPRPLATIAAEIAALSTGDQRRLQHAMAADFLRNNPRFAERLNINISGDEPEE